MHTKMPSALRERQSRKCNTSQRLQRYSSGKKGSRIVPENAHENAIRTARKAKSKMQYFLALTKILFRRC
eukprot:g22763.t1